jgi:hypothetical protein
MGIDGAMARKKKLKVSIRATTELDIEKAATVSGDPIVIPAVPLAVSGGDGQRFDDERSSAAVDDPVGGGHDGDQPVVSDKLGVPNGRTTYRPENARVAKSMCALGATDPDLAEHFGVTLRCIDMWKVKYADFSEAIKAGKSPPDDRVERALYQKAIGYEYDAVKIFMAGGQPVIVPYREKCPPDTTAAIFWLKNRRPDQWRDVHRLEHGRPGAFDQMSDADLDEAIHAEMMAITVDKGGGTAH